MHEVGGTLLDSKGSSTSAERPAFSDEDDVPPPSPTTTGYTLQTQLPHLWILWQNNIIVMENVVWGFRQLHTVHTYYY